MAFFGESKKSKTSKTLLNPISVTNKLIVGFNDNVDRNTAMSIANNIGVRIMYSGYPNIKMIVVDLPMNMPIDAGISKFKSVAGVKYAEPDYERKMSKFNNVKRRNF